MNNVIEITKDLLKKMGVNFSEIVLSQKKENEKEEWIQIKTTENSLFLNKEAEVLESLNHIVKRLAEKEDPVRSLVFVIDVNEHKKQKIEKIKEMAHMMAERAMFFKTTIEFEPMNSYERRVLHVFLEKHPKLKTESIGVGRDRRVVIRYLGESNI